MTTKDEHIGEADNRLEYMLNQARSSEPSQAPSLEGETTTELEYLRAILWGQRARREQAQTERTEISLNRTSRDMLARVEDKLRQLGESQANALHTVQTQLADQLNEQSARSTNQLRQTTQEVNTQLETLNGRVDHEAHTLKNELTSYIDQRIDEQAAQLRKTQEALAARLETVAADMLSQINQVHKSLSNQLTAQTADMNARITAFRSDSTQASNLFRNDVEMRLTTLDKQLAARRDMGQLYLELSRNLYGNP